MTEQDAKPEHENKKDARLFPGVLFFLQLSFKSTWRMKRFLFLYSSWICIPFLGLLSTPFLPEGWATPVSYFMQGLIFFISSWISCLVINVIASCAITPVTDTWLEPDNIELRARQRLPFFLITAIIVAALEAAGTLFFILPGIILFIFLAFAPLIAATETMNPFAAMRQSIALVKPNAFALGERIVLGALLFFLTTLFLQNGALLLVGGLLDIPAETLAQHPIPALDVIFSLINLVFLPPHIAYQTLLYVNVKNG